MPVLVIFVLLGLALAFLLGRSLLMLIVAFLRLLWCLVRWIGLALSWMSLNGRERW